METPINGNNSLKIYLASPLARQLETYMLARELEADGHVIVSSWHDAEDKMAAIREIGKSIEWEPYALKWSTLDLEEVMSADLVVVRVPSMEEHNNSTGGTYVELGAALAAGKEVLLYREEVGEIKANPFFHHSGISLRLVGTASVRNVLRLWYPSGKEATLGNVFYIGVIESIPISSMGRA